MTIQQNGNVGIGTSGSANKLAVVGNADFSGSVGIGTTTPAYKLSVVSAPALGNPVALIQNTSGGNLSDGLHI
ncbi:hypothetical protein, partial [Salmonella sp. SAL4356]|uniref:hypothetical protein n=1 Tax=Salmonella sp. SAL4356 TaxID=3159877 RepID=UPI00397B5D70